MAQEYAHHSPGPRFVGDVFPPAAENGDSFLNTSTTPKSIYIWDGNPGAGRWEFFSYLREVSPPLPPGAPPVITSPNVANAIYDVFFTYQTTATNFPTSWNATNLPANLSVNTSNGLISGIIPSVPSIGIAGYSMGGDPPGTSSRVIKLTFSSETSAQVANLPFAKYCNVGLSGPASGYSCGGCASTTVYSAVDKLLFSSDSVSAITSMATAKQNSCGLSSQTNGYVCVGGLAYNDSPVTSEATKVAFSSDTLTELGNIFPIAGSSANSGVGDKTTKGFVVGYRVGTVGANSNTQKLIFSTDAASNIASGMVNARTLTCGVSSSVNGYDLGGWYSASVFNQIERLAFTSEAITQLGVTLSSPQYNCMPTTSRIAGYGVGGGDLGGWYSTVQKITYATETMSLLGTIVSTGAGCGCENLN